MDEARQLKLGKRIDYVTYQPTDDRYPMREVWSGSRDLFLFLLISWKRCNIAT